jgi:hypothetical protein
MHRTQQQQPKNQSTGLAGNLWVETPNLRLKVRNFQEPCLKHPPTRPVMNEGEREREFKTEAKESNETEIEMERPLNS